MFIPFSLHGFVLERLLFLVLFFVALLVVFKLVIFLMREKKIGRLIVGYKVIWGFFFISYYLLIGFFIYQMLSYNHGQDLRNFVISFAILGLSILFWIGPVRAILGLKTRRIFSLHKIWTQKRKTVSADGWMIVSWLGEGGGIEEKGMTKGSDQKASKTHLGENL